MNFLRTIADRLREPSTWAGVALAAQAVGAIAGRPDIAGAAVTLADGAGQWAQTGSWVALAGAIAAVVLRERGNGISVQQSSRIEGLWKPTRRPRGDRGFD